MGAVTGHAGIVASDEHSGRRYDGLRFAVALGASRERFRSGCMLMSVTGPTRLVRGFAARGVCGHHSGVATCARP